MNWKNVVIGICLLFVFSGTLQGDTGHPVIDGKAITGTLLFDTGTSINEFSIDGTLAGNSDNAVPTEKAVKTYVDGKVPTNLTSFVSQTAWRVFYSNADGDVVELALGADGTYLKSNGPAIAPTFATPAGGGDLKADGSVPLTANWDVGAYTLTGTQFISDISIGTAPFGCTSTTVVPNLNVSFLEGHGASYFQIADAALTSISGLAYVSPSFIKLTANDTYAVRTLAETRTDLNVEDGAAADQSASEVEISELGTATYDNVQDWINCTQSSGRISGGDLSSHVDAVTGVTVGGAGSGEFKVADDQTAGYPAAATITIYGSTNNDGDYTVSAGGSSHSAGTTTIPVDEAVAAVADGNIQNGRADVTAGTGFIKIIDSEVGETKTFDWSASNNIALIDLSTNHTHVNYNAGSPVVQVTDDRDTIELNREFPLGMIYRNGTYTWPHTSGINLPNSIRLAHERLLATRGFERASGGEISAYGTRNIQSTAGKFFRGNNKTTTTGKASATDKMTTVYYNGSNWVWTQDETQINNTQYNNIASGLATLSNNKYSIHWICIDYLSNLYDVFGQGDYTLTEAQVAGVPSLMPVIATDFGIVAAKIIIKKSDAAFTEVISAYTTLIPSASPATHNDLSGLDGGTVGEYYHMTSPQHTIATQPATAAQDGYATSTQIAKLDGIEPSADVTDAANVASTIHGVDAKATPVDADEVGLIDSAAANVLKKVTWANVKATLKTYFDTFYQTILTFGIADTNKVQINSATVADNDIAMFTTTGLEGRNYTEVLAHLSGTAGAEFSFNTQKIGGVVDPTTAQQVATKNYVDSVKRYIQIRLLDEDTSHTADTSIGGDFRFTQAMTVTGVSCYFDTAGTTSVTTIDINEAGATILSTKLTTDATEKTSVTAAAPAVISDSAIAANAIITIDIDGIASGTAGKGLTIELEVTTP